MGTTFAPGSPAMTTVGTPGSARTEHGDFDAFACQSGAATVKRDAVEDTETHGKDAALLALERKTGHRCGQNCNGWQQATKVEE